MCMYVYMHVHFSISRPSTCRVVCGGRSVVTDCVPAIWILAVTYVNVVSMYMDLVIELVHGMFMHFSLHSPYLARTAYSEG